MKQFLCMLATALLSASSPSLQAKVLPKHDRKALACDIHNFLIIKDSKARFAGICRILAQVTTTLLPDIIISPFYRPEGRNARAVLSSATRLLEQGDISGEGFYTIFDQNGYQTLAQSVLEISNAYDAPPGIAQLLDELEANGVLLFVASNIGSGFYHRLCTKNDEMKQLFSHFDLKNPGVTVEFIDADGAIIHHPTKKPAQTFFEAVKSYAQARGIKPENIYFGDDSKAYVTAAQEAGIQSIHFDAQQHGQHTAEALREELIRIGLLNPA